MERGQGRQLGRGDELFRRVNCGSRGHRCRSRMAATKVEEGERDGGLDQCAVEVRFFWNAKSKASRVLRTLKPLVSIVARRGAAGHAGRRRRISARAGRTHAPACVSYRAAHREPPASPATSTATGAIGDQHRHGGRAPAPHRHRGRAGTSVLGDQVGEAELRREARGAGCDLSIRLNNVGVSEVVQYPTMRMHSNGWCSR